MSAARRMLGVVLTAVASTGCTAAEPLTTELVMDEFAYFPLRIVVPADTPGYVLQMTNDGAVPHDMTVDGLPEDVFVHLSVFEDASVPYPLPALPAGTYPVHCALEGHREAGMEATLVVR